MEITPQLWRKLLKLLHHSHACCLFGVKVLKFPVLEAILCLAVILTRVLHGYPFSLLALFMDSLSLLFSWMENALLLIVILDEKMQQPKR